MIYRLDTKIENAKIIGTKLGEDSGCLTAKIFLEGNGWQGVFGGYCIDYWYSSVGEYYSSDGYGAIIEIMKVIGVKSWEDICDKLVRVETTGWGGRLTKIGHIYKDMWFSFDDYFNKVKEFKNGANGVH